MASLARAPRSQPAPGPLSDYVVTEVTPMVPGVRSLWTQADPTTGSSRRGGNLGHGSLSDIGVPGTALTCLRIKQNRHGTTSNTAPGSTIPTIAAITTAGTTTVDLVDKLMSLGAKISTNTSKVQHIRSKNVKIKKI